MPGARERQAHPELAAAPRSIAVDLDRAAVQMNQAAHQRQADAQTAFGALQRRGRLRKHLENLLEHLRRDTDPVVGDRDHGLIRFDSHAYLDCAARIGVLDGVAQQITTI